MIGSMQEKKYLIEVYSQSAIGMPCGLFLSLVLCAVPCVLVCQFIFHAKSPNTAQGRENVSAISY